MGDNDDDDDDDDNPEERKDKNKNWFYRVSILLLALLVIGLNLVLSLSNSKKDRTHIEYQEFKQYLAEGNVEKVTIETNLLNIELKEGENKKCYTERLSGDTRLI